MITGLILGVVGTIVVGSLLPRAQVDFVLDHVAFWKKK